MGDFNINWHKKLDQNTRKLINIIQSAGFKQIVEQPTRITNNSVSLIDLIVTNIFESKIANHINWPKITDHDIVGIVIITKANQPLAQNIIKKRNLSVNNLVKIKHDLIERDWQFQSTNLEKLYNVFQTNINNALNKFAPEIIVHYKPTYKWFNDEIREAQKLRNIAYSRFTLNRSTSNWEEFKTKRNSVVSLIRKAKRAELEKRIDLCKHDSAKMWKTLKGLISGGKQSVIDINFEDITKSAASNFNDFFCNSIKTLASSIEDIDESWNNNHVPAVTHTISKFQLITLNELQNIVFTLKNKSSSETINAKLLKDLFDVIGYPLLNLINTSLETSVIPEDLKTSIIIPIPKISNPQNPQEFRPINILPTVEKVLEIIVHKQVNEYFEKNKLLFDGQFGFRGKHSCETAVQYVCEKWSRDLDNNMSVLSVFVDLQRAFETIDRKILLEKLEYYGVKGAVLRWFKNFLYARGHKTKYRDQCSDSINSNYGVPQGSVLGPLLFIIYINDIYLHVKNCFINLFADDTVLSVSGNNFEEMVVTMNVVLDKLYRWLCISKLKLNVNKTKCMVFGSTNKCNQFANCNLKVKINNCNIETVRCIKYLGVYLDYNLKFKEHINYMCKKIGKKVGFLRRISSELSPWTKRLIYHSIIHPHFTYCQSLLIVCNKTELDKLQLLQNKAMRILLGCNMYYSINYMLKMLCWLPIELLVEKSVLIFIFKIKCKLAPNYFIEKLDIREEMTGYNLRTKTNYNVQKVNKSATMKSIFYNGLIMFNNLPACIKQSKSVKLFSKKVKNYLKERLE